MNSEQLITFSVVAEYGSVSRAAEALNISQSTVSGQLAALQQQMHQPLYIRQGRGIKLTPAGEELLPYAHSVAHSLRHAAQHIQGVRERPTRTFKVGISPILARWAARLMLEAGAVGLSLHLRPGNSSDLVKGVEFSELNAAFIINPLTLPPDRLDMHPLGQDELHLILPAQHPLAQTAPRQAVRLDVLRGETLLTAQACSSIRLQTERLLEASGLRDVKLLEVASYCGIRDGLLDGYGVSLLPKAYLRREVESGQLACLRLASHFTTLSYALLTPPVATLDPEERELTDFLLTLRPVLQGVV